MWSVQLRLFLLCCCSTLSMKELRAHLEKDLKLKPQELKPFKKFIETKTLKVFVGDAVRQLLSQMLPQ